MSLETSLSVSFGSILALVSGRLSPCVDRDGCQQFDQPGNPCREREIFFLKVSRESPRIVSFQANLGHMPDSEPATVGSVYPRVGVCARESVHRWEHAELV